MPELPPHLECLLEEIEDEQRATSPLRAILTAAWAVGESRGADEILRTVERLTEALADA
jgi:hypothetical protein